MKSKSMTTEAPSLSREEALPVLNDFISREGGNCTEEHHLVYCSWPEVFSSTSGPFSGIGGMAFTEFRMEAWKYGGFAVVFTGGRIVKACRLDITAEWKH